jgi:hypothetical protein
MSLNYQIYAVLGTHLHHNQMPARPKSLKAPALALPQPNCSSNHRTPFETTLNYEQKHVWCGLSAEGLLHVPKRFPSHFRPRIRRNFPSMTIYETATGRDGGERRNYGDVERFEAN